MPGKERGRAALWGLASFLLFAGWQQLTVARNFDGNWTALFCTGRAQPIPPELRQGTYLVRSPTGFDGQMYRYVAHDPFLTGTAHQYLDSPPLRARRILVPGLSWLLAFGQQQWIDFTYILLCFAACFLGAYWAALLCYSHHLRGAWALLFLAIPATVIATDRLVVDLATCALTVGMLWYHRCGNWRMVALILLLNCLCRETGFLFVAAFILSALAARRWRHAALFASAAIPALAWYGYVQFRLGRVEVPSWLGRTTQIGPLQLLLHPVAYPFKPAMTRLTQALDSLAILGLLLALALAIVFGWNQWKESVPLSALLFAGTAFLTLDPRFWETVHNFARPYSPVLVVLAAHAPGSRHPWLWLSPIAMMDLRIGYQLAPQILGIFGIHIAS